MSKAANVAQASMFAAKCFERFSQVYGRDKTEADRKEIASAIIADAESFSDYIRRRAIDGGFWTWPASWGDAEWVSFTTTMTNLIKVWNGEPVNIEFHREMTPNVSAN